MEINEKENNNNNEIEKILNRRRINGKYEFLVKYKNNKKENSWVPLKNLINFTNLLENFNKNHPFKKKFEFDYLNEIDFIKSEKKKEIILGKKIKILNNFNENLDKKEIKCKKIDFEHKIMKLNSGDERIIEIIQIKRKNNMKIATILFKKDIFSLYEIKEIPCYLLKVINPFVLIKFYESKIKFFEKN